MPANEKADKDLFEFVTGVRDAALPMREDWQNDCALVASFYQGHSLVRITGQDRSTLKWLGYNRDADSADMRVGYNISSKLVQRAAAATEPINIQVDAFPPDRSIGVRSAVECRVIEDATNELIDATGFVRVWGDANHGRAVYGSYLVGWCLAGSSATMPTEDGETQVPDVRLEAFADLPFRLSLDPRNMERDLSKHEYVVYSRAWTIGKIRRVYGDLLEKRGIKINDKKLDTISQLSSFEVEMNQRSGNRLFSGYRYESNTRGAIVHQVHRRGEGANYSRFEYMDVLIELPDSAVDQTNRVVRDRQFVRLTPEGENISPFGGDGLPFCLIHGHRRSDGMPGIGDQKMIVDDQERVNRMEMWGSRQLRNSSHTSWLVDKRTMGNLKKEDDIRQQFSNAINAVRIYESGMGQDRGQPPQLVQHPQANAIFFELQKRYQDDAKENIHRAQGHFGEVKTHQTAQAFNRAMDEAAQVLDLRVANDKKDMERMLGIGIGTLINRVREQSPAMLAWLDARDFTGDDMAMLAQANPFVLPCTIKVRESSIRLRSSVSRKADLDQAASLQMVDPRTYIREMAAMDTPVAQADREFLAAFEGFALNVMIGMEWEPMPFGVRTGDLVEAFQRAIVDRRATPEGKQRLARAIQMQEMLFAQQQAMLNPEAGPTQPAPPPDPAEGALSALADTLSAQAA